MTSYSFMIDFHYSRLLDNLKLLTVVIRVRNNTKNMTAGMIVFTAFLPPLL
jgi:hypothetical protein